MMKTHKFKTSMTLPVSIGEVFEFFSDAGNLEIITPPELRFSIVTPLPISIREGALIEYKLKLAGFSFSWLTKISRWNPPYEFIDEQIKGPYKLWIHRHSFTFANGHTLIKDEVEYQLPFYPFSEIISPIIRLQLKRIFSYRQIQIKQILVQT